MTNKNSFALFNSQREIVEALTDEEAGQLLKALYKYNQGEKPELKGTSQIAFITIRQQIDWANEQYASFCEKQKANGLKGGRPKKEETQENPKNPTVFLETQENPTEPNESQKTLYDNDNDNDIDNDINNDNKRKEKIKKEKKKFGEFLNVLLTEEEEKKLRELYNGNFNDAIETLSNYIKSNGKNYKDHYAVLRKNNWVYERVMKQEPVPIKSSEVYQYGF